MSLKEIEEKILSSGELDSKGQYYQIDTNEGKIKRCWEIWNLYHPEDPIETHSDYCIHHKDEDKTNDHIWNLQKMTKSDHMRLHSTDRVGEKNGMYGKGYLVEGEKNGFYDKHHTDEQKNKWSTDRTGEKNPMHGNGHLVAGEKHHNAKTTEKEVLEMRELWDDGKGVDIKDLVVMFNSTEVIVYKAINRITWKHI